MRSVASLAAALAVFAAPSAWAANGTAYYFDVDGTNPGFGLPSGGYNEGDANWTTDTTGSSATVAIPGLSPGAQLTFGFSPADFDGATFSVNLNGQRWAGLVVNATNANVTLTGTANAYIHDDSTWNIAAGSVLTDNDNRQQFDAGGTGALKGINFNRKNITLNGGGTINFNSPAGCNSTTSGVITEDMPGGTVNFLMPSDTPSGAGTYQAGYTLVAGNLNFASPGSANQFYGFTPGNNFTINGGTIDNTSGSAMTLNFSGGGGISIGGDFTFVGSTNLDCGTAPVTLTVSPTITVVSNTLAMGGGVSGDYGLTKLGDGTLSLGGANTYGGDTLVLGGALQLGTSAGGGQIMVSGATLDLSLLAGPASSAALSLTNTMVVFSGITGVTNETVDTLNLAGTTNIINIASLPTITSYPSRFHLISYTTLNGVTNVGLGTLPPNVAGSYTGYVTNNASNKSVDLVLTGGPAPARRLTWTGTDPNNPNTWDVANSVNWADTNGTATTYNQSDFVTFDDSATGPTSITLATTLLPTTLMVSNNSHTYNLGNGNAGGGHISGATGLTKDGTGLLVLDESGNDFSGGLTINAGTVQVGNGDSLGSVGAGPVIDNGALAFDNSYFDVFLSGITNDISGTGTVTQKGGDTLQLSGNNSFSGGVTVNNNSVLQLGSYSALGDANNITTVASGSTLDLNGFTAGGVVMAQGAGNGNGAVDNSSGTIAGYQAGDGVHYVGLTNLTLMGDTTIGASGNRWDLRSPGGTTGDPGTATLSTGGQPYNLIKVGSGGSSAGFVGIVSATVDPSLANIDVQGGILEVEGNTTGLGNPTNTLTLEPGTTFQMYSMTNQLNKVVVVKDGATLNAAHDANTIVGPITFTNTGISGSPDCYVNVATGTGYSLTLSGPITGDGVIHQITGTGLLTLSGDSPDFAGGVNVSLGTLDISGVLSNALGMTVSGIGMLKVDGTVLGAGVTNSVGTVAGSGVIGNSLDVGSVGIVAPGDLGVPGTLTMNGLTLEPGAQMTMDLTYNNTVGGGTNDLLSVNGDVTVNGNQININPLGIVKDGVPYRLVNYTGHLIWNSDPYIVAPNNYTFTIDTNTPGQINVVASGGPPVWNGGSATDSNWSDSANWGGVALNYDDPVFFDGNNRLNNVNDTTAGNAYGNIEFAATAGSFVLNGNPIGLDGSSILNDSTNLQTINLGLSFGAAQTFDGGTGGLLLGGGLTNTAVSGAVTLTLAGNGRLNDVLASAGADTIFATSADANWTILDNPANVAESAPGGIVIGAGGILTFGSTNSAPNLTLLGSTANGIGDATGTTVMNMVNGSLTLPNRLNVGNGTAGAILNMSGGTLTVPLLQIADNNMSTVGTVNMNGGVINDTGIFYLTSRGTGTLNLNGGVVNVGSDLELARNLGGQTPHGTLNLNGGALAVRNIQSSSTVSGSTANVNFNGGTLQAIENYGTFMNVNTTTPLVATVMANGALIDSSNYSITIPVPLEHDSGLGAAPDGGLTKLGTGTLILSGANTYTGPTVVSNGTLQVDGSLAAGAVAAENGATLAGAGSVGGTVVVNAGGAIAPANLGAIGTLTVAGDVTLQGNAAMDINAATLTNDVLKAGGSITYGGTLTVTNLAGTLAAGESFQLFNAASYSGTFDATNLPDPGTGLGWVWTPATGTLSLITTVVPVPHITGISLSGTTLSLTGTNGAGNGNYVLLESTNVALPLAQWTPVLTNSFDSGGSLNLQTNIVNPGNEQEFYILQTQ